VKSLDISRNPDLCNSGFYLICDALLPSSNVLESFSAESCGLDSELDASVLRSFSKLRRFLFDIQDFVLQELKFMQDLLRRQSMFGQHRHSSRAECPSCSPIQPQAHVY
jgi:hypothetical protein